MKTIYVCQSCGHTTGRWVGKCIACDSWDTVVEEIAVKTDKKNVSAPILMKALSDNEIITPERFLTGIEELDRVFGGGIVQGASILIGGEPGIGKSTLLLRIAANLTQSSSFECLYVSGEESLEQVSLRAKRLKINEPKIKLLSTVSSTDVITAVKENKNVKFLIIDSIQTMYDSRVTSAPGTVTQVRTCAHELTVLAKQYGVSLLIVGHITKDGQIAGPKTLEHMVDTVLYFEGENSNQYRILRTIKNRFGPANEIGVFEMSEAGLVPVDNPSSLFLMGNGTHDREVVGSAVFAGIEGSRPILMEVQALIAGTNMATPRRAVVGWDINRLAMIIAVLNARCKIFLHDKEVYLNIAGGLKIQEPSADLAVAASLISSVVNLPLPASAIICGEVALSGEIRNISHADLRLKEAQKLGFKKAIMPENGNYSSHDIEIIKLGHVRELRNIFS
ncbi:DNA repair protein RadA [Wolbachia endosymbiont of Folsomia candida]|uniref:DNA repair protein RadA n=1 Tax=Wolbachia endosymbiont of Folsomia candida TaxID=169402 RepID=UPI000A718FF0|nr:DNA repair protein RadA [Wolbachia endosymbiont of Folsomia candida]APR97813.1 DNA repair protein RadA [Wolbachia endosymbiont of Folsomia candida]